MILVTKVTLQNHYEKSFFKKYEYVRKIEYNVGKVHKTTKALS